MKEKSNLSACRRQWGWGNDAQGESPFGPSPELGNRSAIPTFPHPRRLLHSFKIQTRKGIIPRRLPPSLQAHSSIGKGYHALCRLLPPTPTDSNQHLLQGQPLRGMALLCRAYRENLQVLRAVITNRLQFAAWQHLLQLPLPALSGC